MSKPLILDSSALLAVFFKEIGASVVLDGMRPVFPFSFPLSMTGN